MATETPPTREGESDDAAATAQIEAIRLGVRGMTCASCVRRIERALNAVPGVELATVNLATEEASVTFAGTGIDEMREAIERAGYDMRVPGEAEDETRDALELERQADYRALRRRTVFALATAAVLLLAMPLTSWAPGFDDIPGRVLHPLFFALALPVQFWAGWRFYDGAWRVGRHGATDMNTLIAVGTSAAFAYSVVATFVPQVFSGVAGLEPAVYYDTAAANRRPRAAGAAARSSREGADLRGGAQPDRPASEAGARAGGRRRVRDPDLRRAAGRHRDRAAERADPRRLRGDRRHLRGR